MTSQIPHSFEPWRRPLIKPHRLEPGDRIAAVTPCSGHPAMFPERYNVGKRQLSEVFGLEVVEMRNTLRDAAWLDRNPAARAEDLMEAFADPRIKAVVATIGGDDAVRLIPYLDLSVIAKNPKIFLGFSDPTVLHFACLKAGVVSFYGPTVMAGFAENGGMHAYTIDGVRRALFSPVPIGEVPVNTEGWTMERLDWGNPELQNQRRRLESPAPPRRLQGEGIVQGRLIGGCAEVLEMLKGSDLWPPLEYWRGGILFYETSEEAPSPDLVLRWLRNYAAQGILHLLNGVIFARPGGLIDSARHPEYDRAFTKAFDEAGLPDLPLLTDFDIGHTTPMWTLPYGVQAELDCTHTRLTILESGVS